VQRIQHVSQLAVIQETPHAQLQLELVLMLLPLMYQADMPHGQMEEEE